MIKLFKRIKGLADSLSGQFSDFHIEIDKNKSGLTVLVGGAFSVKEYQDTSCVLKTAMGEVKMLGKGLDIAVYENKTVEISGRVEEVCFAYSKN